MPHSLKRLTFTSKNHIGTCLEIDAPDLKYLSLTRIMFEGSTIVNLHKVNEAYLDLVSLPRPGKNLLRALSKIKRLVLGGSTMKDPLPPLYEWVPKPKGVPKCLVSHLTFIKFTIFQGNLNELKFIEYVLRKGLVLKTLHISCLSKEKDNIFRQFFNTPRGSVSCQLKFD